MIHGMSSPPRNKLRTACSSAVSLRQKKVFFLVKISSMGWQMPVYI